MLARGVSLLRFAPTATTHAQKIKSTRTKFLGDNHIATGEACYTLGLLHLFVGNTAAAQEHIGAASAIYNEHLGPDHPSTRDVKEVLKQLHEAALFNSGSGGGGGGGGGGAGAGGQVAGTPGAPGPAGGEAKA